MRPSDLQSALHTAFFLIALAASVRGKCTKGSGARTPASSQNRILQNLPWFVGTRLSWIDPHASTCGAESEYLEDQLRAFIERKRPSFFMSKVADVLSPPMQKALASHFNELDPKPLGGAPKELVATGKAIYEEGVPVSKVAPCSSCHGPAAKGDGTFPRLAGQLHEYISGRLASWRKERQERPETDASGMESIARSLTESQISAVAAYLSYLE